MATYAMGDIQGCYNELQQLLKLIQFDSNHDILWSVGDLVNRGPHSLEVLRFFKQLGERAVVVLGNHDLQLLTVAHGHTEYLRPGDTLMPVLQAADCQELVTWLRHRPLLHHDANLGFTLIHAGLPPQWDLAQARQYAAEVETVLRGNQYGEFLDNLYGSDPKKWSTDLKGFERLRFITNCFTRLRYCNAKGKLALKKKDSPQNYEDEYPPWFALPNRASRDTCIVFGHWSTLGYYAGHNVYALDNGCVWGGKLVALRLEDRRVFSIRCKGECIPGMD